jgi:FkbM family methyltransferase
MMTKLVSMLREKFPNVYFRLSSFYRLKFRPRLGLLYRRKYGVLVYVGGNHGESLIDIVHLYKRVIVFECNPVFIEVLKRRFARFKNVEVYPFAASDEFSTVNLALPSNGNFFGSASLGSFSPDHPVSTLGYYPVYSVRLADFLEFIGVRRIYTYISDIEGYDFRALSTLKNLLVERKIVEIQVEVWSEDIPYPFAEKGLRIYEKDFIELLGSNYIKSNEGIANLRSGNWILEKNWSSKDVQWKLDPNLI